MTEIAQYDEALRALESGDDHARTRVAFFKLSGRGGAEIDVDGAIALLKERADGTDDEAKWMLGLCFEYGVGVKQNAKRALSLYRQSSEAENVVGKFLMRNGDGGKGSKVMEVRGCLLSWNNDTMKKQFISVLFDKICRIR